MLISAVVPCYNEEKVLGLTYNELSTELGKITDDYEMIFVDDGSRDATRSILKDFAESDRHVKYISFSRNFGKESAMLAGMRYSSADYTERSATAAVTKKWVPFSHGHITGWWTGSLTLS